MFNNVEEETIALDATLREAISGLKDVDMQRIMKAQDAAIDALTSAKMELEKAKSLYESAKLSTQKGRGKAQLDPPLHCCGEVYRKKDRAICCDVCDRWVHCRKECAHLTSAKAEAIEFYVCGACSDEVKKLKVTARSAADTPLGKLQKAKLEAVVEVRQAEQALEEAEEVVANHRGPQATRHSEIIELMQLKRKVYHNRALDGNDEAKTHRWEVQRALVSLLNPKSQRKGLSPEERRRRSRRAEQVLTAWRKFTACRNLWAWSDGLCKHQVWQLMWRANSLGNVVPRVYPNKTLPFKFHNLVYNIPKFAERHGTVGMHSEHAIEHAHVYIERMRCRYRKAGSDVKEATMIARRMSLNNNQDNPRYRRPKRNRRVNNRIQKVKSSKP